MTPEIDFHPLGSIANDRLTYAVIAARYRGKWVFCRHRDRTTLEIPGGHREPHENIYDTAKRELYEETGALDFTIRPVCLYSVAVDKHTGYGGLFYAAIYEMDALPDSEIAEIFLLDAMPDDLTYPQIQPHLLEKVKKSVGL